MESEQENQNVDFQAFLESLYENPPKDIMNSEVMQKILKENEERRAYDAIHNPLKVLNDELTYNLVLSTYNMIDSVIEKYQLQKDLVFLEFSLLLGFAIITGDSIELITNNLIILIDKIIQISFQRNDPYYFNVIHDGMKHWNGPYLSIFTCYFDKK